MSQSALEIIGTFQQKMNSGDETWTELFHEDVHFKGPVDETHGKASFIELNNNFMPMVQGYQPAREFEQGSLAMLEGVFTVKAPSGKNIDLEIAEIYEVIDGKIKSMRIYYDAEEFRKEFAIN